MTFVPVPIGWPDAARAGGPTVLGMMAAVRGRAVVAGAAMVGRPGGGGGGGGGGWSGVVGGEAGGESSEGAVADRHLDEVVGHGRDRGGGGETQPQELV